MPEIKGFTCPHCSSTMTSTHPNPQNVQDHFYAECPECGFKQTPETVRVEAQKVIDDIKAARKARKLAKK